MDEESQSSTTMEKALPHHVENSVGVSSGSMTPKDSAFPVEENHVEHKQQAPEPQQPPEKQQDEDPSQEQSQQPSPGKMPRIPQHGVCRVWLPLEFGRGFSAIRVQGTVGQAKAEVLRKLESHGKADPKSDSFFAIARSPNSSDRIPDDEELSAAVSGTGSRSFASTSGSAFAGGGGSSHQLHLVRIQGQPRFRPSIPLLRMLLVVEDARLVSQLAGSLPAELPDRHLQEAVHVSWTTLLVPPLAMAAPNVGCSAPFSSISNENMNKGVDKKKSQSSPPVSESSSAVSSHVTDLSEADAVVLCYNASSDSSLEQLKEFSRKLLCNGHSHQSQQQNPNSGRSQQGPQHHKNAGKQQPQQLRGVPGSLAEGFRLPLAVLGVDNNGNHLGENQPQPQLIGNSTGDLARAFAGLELRCPHVSGTAEALGVRLKAFCSRVHDERSSGSRTYARSLIDDALSPQQPTYHRHDVFVLLEGDNGQGVATGELLGRLFKIPTEGIEILNNSSALPRFVHIEDISIPTVKWMDKYTLFGIEVRPHSCSPWVVFARYSRCLRLFEALKRDFPEHGSRFPPFPKKKLFNSSTSLVETRRAEISTFLQHVVGIPQLMQSPSLQQFLETRLHSQEVVADSLPFWVKTINEAPLVVPKLDEMPPDGGEAESMAAKSVSALPLAAVDAPPAAVVHLGGGLEF